MPLVNDVEPLSSRRAPLDLGFAPSAIAIALLLEEGVLRQRADIKNGFTRIHETSTIPALPLAVAAAAVIVAPWRSRGTRHAHA